MTAPAVPDEGPEPVGEEVDGELGGEEGREDEVDHPEHILRRGAGLRLNLGLKAGGEEGVRCL